MIWLGPRGHIRGKLRSYQLKATSCLKGVLVSPPLLDILLPGNPSAMVALAHDVSDFHLRRRAKGCFRAELHPGARRGSNEVSAEEILAGFNVSPQNELS